MPDKRMHATRDTPPVIYLDGAGRRVMPGVRLLLGGKAMKMKSGNRLSILLTLSLAALLTNVSAGGAKDVQLTDGDKAAIVRDILMNANLLERGLRLGEVKGEIYLSTENISPQIVPKLSGVKFISLDPKGKDDWPKAGYSLFEFSDFKVRGSKVVVSLTDSWSYDPGQYRKVTYEYRKASGKWRGRAMLVSVSRR